MFFLSALMVSYMAAFITSLAFEAPMMGLEKIIFRRDEKRSESVRKTPSDVTRNNSASTGIDNHTLRETKLA